MIFLRNYRSLTALLFCAMHATLTTPLLMADLPQQDRVVPSTYARLAQDYLPSLTQKAMAEEQSNANNAKNPNNIPTLGDVEKLKLSYNLLGLQSDLTTAQDTPVSGDVTNDLKLFCGSKNTPEENVFNVLDNTTTTFGKIELQKILATPLTDKNALILRQEFIKKLVEDEQLFNRFQTLIDQAKTSEDNIIWFWKVVEKEVEQLLNQVYFNNSPENFALSRLNQSSSSLQALHTWQTIGSPIPSILQVMAFVEVTFIITYCMIDACAPKFWKDELAQRVCGTDFNFIDLQKNLLLNPTGLFFDQLEKGSSKYYGVAAGFGIVGGIGLIAALMGIRNGIKSHNIATDIHTKMIHVATFTNTLKAIETIFGEHQELTQLFPEHKDLDIINTNQSPETQELISLLETNTFTDEASFFSLKGKALAAYSLMQLSKNNFIDSCKAVGKLDAYLSIAKLYKKSVSAGQAPWCFVEYAHNAATPSISLTNYWHPILNPAKVVTNSINIGKDYEAPNIIVTGPNAGGKSTSLKAIALAVLLGQTFGIAPAQKMILTPFTLFKTYLNISDEAGKESLFQAEMNRAQDLLANIERLNAHEFSFAILDEIFTGTNPDEGQAGAYAIAECLGECKNSLCLLATHYKKLPELAMTAGRPFKNFKVSVTMDDQGAITPTYTLTEGISNQRIALQLLQNAGFNKKLLNTAYGVLNEQKLVAVR